MAGLFRRMTSAAAEWLSSYSRHSTASNFSKFKVFHPEVGDPAPVDGSSVRLYRWKGTRSSSYRLVMAGYIVSEYGTSLAGVADGSKAYKKMVGEYTRALWLAPVVDAYADAPVFTGPLTQSTTALLNLFKLFVVESRKLPKFLAKRISRATPPADQVLYFAVAMGLLDYVEHSKPAGATLMGLTDSIGNSPLHVAIELIGDADFAAADPYQSPPLDLEPGTLASAGAAASAGASSGEDVAEVASPGAGLAASSRPVPQGASAARLSDLHPLYLWILQSLLMDPVVSVNEEALGPLLSLPNIHGDTPLHTAAALNQAVILRSLIANGADARVLNGAGSDPMHVAVQASALACIRSLVSLEHGGTQALEWALANVETHEATLVALDGELAKATAPVGGAGAAAKRPKAKYVARLAQAIATVCTLLQLGSPFEPRHIEQAARLGSVDILRAFVVFGVMERDDVRFKPSLVALVDTLQTLGVESQDRARYMACLNSLVAAGADTAWLIASDESILTHDDLLDTLVGFEEAAFGEADAAAAFGRVSGDQTVLALDGGGIRGLLLVDMLRELMDACASEAARDVAVWDVFDVICGTSTGGILALALGIRRLSLSECASLYFDFAADVFAAGDPPYDPVKLKAIVDSLIGEDVPLASADNSTRVFTVATNVTQMPPSTFVFRNYDVAPDNTVAFEGTKQATVTDAVLATSAAPTFFPAYPFRKVDDDEAVGLEPSEGAAAAGGSDLVLVDGALVYNTPVIPALLETSDLDVAHVVNLGTGTARPKGVTTVESMSPQVIPGIIHSKSGSVSTLASSFISGNLHKREINAFRSVMDAIMAASFSGNETQPIEYMCKQQRSSFVRLNPWLESAALDEGDVVVVVNLLWESRCFIRAHRPKLQALARALVTTKGLGGES